MTIKETIEESEKEFDYLLEKNGIKSLLDYNFEENKVLIIINHIKQSQIKLIESILEEIEENKLEFKISENTEKREYYNQALEDITNLLKENL